MGRGCFYSRESSLTATFYFEELCSLSVALDFAYILGGKESSTASSAHSIMFLHSVYWPDYKQVDGGSGGQCIHP